MNPWRECWRCRLFAKIKPGSPRRSQNDRHDWKPGLVCIGWMVTKAEELQTTLQHCRNEDWFLDTRALILECRFHSVTWSVQTKQPWVYHARGQTSWPQLSLDQYLLRQNYFGEELARRTHILEPMTDFSSAHDPLLSRPHLLFFCRTIQTTTPGIYIL